LDLRRGEEGVERGGGEAGMAGEEERRGEGEEGVSWVLGGGRERTRAVGAKAR